MQAPSSQTVRQNGVRAGGARGRARGDCASPTTCNAGTLRPDLCVVPVDDWDRTAEKRARRVSRSRPCDPALLADAAEA